MKGYSTPHQKNPPFCKSVPSQSRRGQGSYMSAAGFLAERVLILCEFSDIHSKPRLETRHTNTDEVGRWDLARDGFTTLCVLAFFRKKPPRSLRYFRLSVGYGTDEHLGQYRGGFFGVGLLRKLGWLMIRNSHMLRDDLGKSLFWKEVGNFFQSRGFSCLFVAEEMGLGIMCCS